MNTRKVEKVGGKRVTLQEIEDAAKVEETKVPETKVIYTGTPPPTPEGGIEPKNFLENTDDLSQEEFEKNHSTIMAQLKNQLK